MGRIAISVLLAAGLSGCDYVDKATEMALGLKHQQVPLAGITVVSVKGFRIQNKTIKVLGKDSSVCLSFLGGTAPQELLSLLRGSTLSGYMIMGDGTKVMFNSIGKSWSSYGQEPDPNKPAICLLPQESWVFKDGQVVDTIVVQADPQLQVQSIYWDSWNADELFKERS